MSSGRWPRRAPRRRGQHSASRGEVLLPGRAACSKRPATKAHAADSPQAKQPERPARQRAAGRRGGKSLRGGNGVPVVQEKVAWTTTDTQTTDRWPDPCRHGEHAGVKHPHPGADTPEAVTHVHRHQTAGRGRGDAVWGWPWPGATQTHSTALGPVAPGPMSSRSLPCPTRGAQ